MGWFYFQEGGMGNQQRIIFLLANIVRRFIDTLNLHVRDDNFEWLEEEKYSCQTFLHLSERCYTGDCPLISYFNCQSNWVLLS